MSKLSQNLLQQNEEVIRRLYVDEKKSCLQVCEELSKMGVHVSTMTVLHFLKCRGWCRSRKERLFDAVCRNCNQKFKGGSSVSCLCDLCRPIRSAIFIRYGLSRSQYEKLLQKQNENCAICKRNFCNKTPSVDHCHKTGLIRGLLCGPCNLCLGCVESNGGFAEYVKSGLENGIIPHSSSQIAKAMKKFGSCTTANLNSIKCPNRERQDNGEEAQGFD